MINHTKLEKKWTPPKILFLPHSWQGHNQILCFIIIILIIVGIGLYLLSYLLMKLSITILEESSNKIFQQEILSQVNRYTSLQKSITNSYFTDSLTNIQNINALFNKIQTAQVEIDLPPKCIFAENIFDSYVRESQFCQDFCNATDLKDLHKYKDYFYFTSLLTEYIGLYNIQLYTYFTQKDDNQYFAIFNADTPKGYMPHKRQWYIDHIKQMSETNQQTFISSPYFALVDTIFIAFTQSLIDKNNEFQGVIGQDADFTNLPKFNDDNVMPTIINQQGDLIMSAFYKHGQSEIAKIYNETITGFTEKDWEYLKKQADEKISVNLYIYNSLYKKNILVSIYKMTKFQQYIILYFHFFYDRTINDQQYIQDEEFLFKKYEIFQNELITALLYMIFGIITVILVSEYFFLKWLQSDLILIQKIAKYKMKALKYKKIEKSVMKGNNTTIKELAIAFFNLLSNFSSSKVKGSICQELEQLQYPTKKNRLRIPLRVPIMLRFNFNSVKQRFNSFQLILSSITSLHKKKQIII